MAKEPPERVEGLAIVEKYDQFVEYVYPILQNIPRRHGQFRDRILNTMFDVPERIYVATKTNQVSRIREVDARLASLRWQLRFAAHPKRKLISQHQNEVASVHLAEVGSMVGAWAKRRG